MNPQIIQSRAARVWLDEHGIAHALALETAEGTAEEVREIIAAIAQLSGGVTVPLLSQVDSLKAPSRAGREYIARESPNHVRAVAMLVKSPLARMLASFFLGVNKPPVPLQLFENEAEAIEWLKGFLA